MAEDLLIDSSQPRYNTVADSPDQNGAGRRSLLSLRYGSTRKCVNSKAALLILLWSFVVGLWNAVAINPDYLMKNFVVFYQYVLAGFGFVAVVMCFFPLAGFLADTKGHYKTVARSLFLLLISILLIGVAGIFLFVYTVIALAIVVGFVVLSYVGVAGFSANAIQFGMDQLHDSPGEDRTLFIHWYVWTYFLSIFTGQLGWVLLGNNDLLSVPFILGSSIVGSIPLVIIVVLVATLCLARRRRRWFLIEPGTLNPYKLVYRVTKFSRQHKVPVHRIAFTPSGLDLAKDNNEGPFTIEQVQDVKSFYEIRKILISFGIIFSLEFAVESLVALYATNICNNASIFKYSIFSTGLFSPLLAVVCIPLYLCLLRPFISHHIPLLKSIGLGMVLAVLSVAVFFSMDTAAHYKNNNSTQCMFTLVDTSSGPSCSQDPVYLIFPLALSSLSHMLIYPAAFEFICSQSPHSMKGLLIGLLYTIKGLYQLLAIVFVIPFAAGLLKSVHPSCGFYYFLTNTMFGVLGFVWFVWVAKRYKYREINQSFSNNTKEHSASLQQEQRLESTHQQEQGFYPNPLQEQRLDSNPQQEQETSEYDSNSQHEQGFESSSQQIQGFDYSIFF